jgi:hypothetical protein
MTDSGMMCLLKTNQARRTVMERFLMQHEDRIKGSISGFDRVLFRGTLLALSHCQGLARFLSSQSVLYRDFKTYAQALSKQLKEHAEAMAQHAGRPLQYVNSAQRSKEEIALRIKQRDNIQAGLICVLSCVEPCQSFSVRGRRERQQLTLVSEERKALHYYFYYLHREFGLLHVRLQTWFPFTIQVCVNGREWLARQLRREGIDFVQADNCFTDIADLQRAQELMDSLSQKRWAPFLNALARAVNPLMKSAASVHLQHYYWSARQCEYATDIMFSSPAALAQIYPALVRHAMEQFHSEDVLRFLGRRTSNRFNGEVKGNLRRFEGVRVKHWAEENSIKMYDKQGSILRIETTINNPRRFSVYRLAQTAKGKGQMRWLPMRKGIVDLRRRVELSRAANERYLDALAVVGVPTPARALLDKVSKRVTTKRRSFRPLRPISPEDSQLFRLLMDGASLLHGIRNRDICRRLGSSTADPATRRRLSNRVTRVLALLRAHRLIFKISGKNAYRTTKLGREIMCTAIKFRDSDLALLAA